MHLRLFRLQNRWAEGVDCAVYIHTNQLKVDICLVDGDVREVKHVGDTHGARVGLSPNAEIIVLSIPEGVTSANFLHGNKNLSVNSLVKHARSNIAFESDILTFSESGDIIFLETFSLESYLLHFVFEIIVLFIAHVG